MFVKTVKSADAVSFWLIKLEKGIQFQSLTTSDLSLTHQMLTDFLLSNNSVKNETLGMFIDRNGHNFSIISPTEHNFEHNTLVSRVTPESIIPYFSSIIRQTLVYGNMLSRVADVLLKLTHAKNSSRKGPAKLRLKVI